jgi:hypothetical protein
MENKQPIPEFYLNFYIPAAIRDSYVHRYPNPEFLGMKVHHFQFRKDKMPQKAALDILSRNHDNITYVDLDLDQRISMGSSFVYPDQLCAHADKQDDRIAEILSLAQKCCRLRHLKFSLENPFINLEDFLEQSNGTVEIICISMSSKYSIAKEEFEPILESIVRCGSLKCLELPIVEIGSKVLQTCVDLHSIRLGGSRKSSLTESTLFDCLCMVTI